MRVLIVEDSPADAELVERALRADDAGTDLVHSSTLEHALDQLRTRTFDVVLLDLTLPGTSGLETLQAMLPMAGETPVVVLTGLQDEETGAMALRTGAEDYLVKAELRPRALRRTLRYAVERAAVRRLIASQNRELELRNQDLDAYAHLLAHDLRAPLRAITNYASWLREDLGNALSSEVAQKLGRLEENARSLGQMVEAALARATRREAPEATGRAVERVVRDAVKVLSPPRSFPVRIHPLPPVQAADWVSLQRVLQNLVDNAIQHHDRGQGEVHVAATADGRWVEFVVEDDGPGIAQELLPKLFARGPTITGSRQMHGFGLRSVREAVLRNGGVIDVTPKAPRGSRFRFTWPALPPSQEPPVGEGLQARSAAR